VAFLHLEKIKRYSNQANKFRKDFTPEQYGAYLERKAKNPDALISEDNHKT